MNRNSRPLYVGALALALIAICFVGIANAQSATRVTNCSPTTPNNSLCLDWTAPATNTDGTPTVLALHYRVERRIGVSGTWSTIAPDVTVARYYAQGLAVGTHYFRVYAFYGTPNTVESDPSSTASAATTAPPTQPNPPPTIIIAATIRADGPPIYRIVYTVKPRAGEIVFVAPESMRPVFAAR